MNIRPLGRPDIRGRRLPESPHPFGTACTDDAYPVGASTAPLVACAGCLDHPRRSPPGSAVCLKQIRHVHIYFWYAVYSRISCRLTSGCLSQLPKSLDPWAVLHLFNSPNKVVFLFAPCAPVVIITHTLRDTTKTDLRYSLVLRGDSMHAVRSHRAA